MKNYSFTLNAIIGALVFALIVPGLAVAQQNTTYQYQYDAVGNKTKITDPLGRTHDLEYDTLSRQKVQRGPNINGVRPVINYGYDGRNQLTSVSDPRNLSTTYTINGLGNQTLLTSPDTGATQTTYDEAGNVKTVTDAKQQTTVYQYDSIHRVTSVTYHDGSVVSYTYDLGSNAKGRLSGITDANGSIQYGYDQKGNVVSETRVINNGTYQTGYGYDNVGQLASITYPSGRVISYSRDPLGRILQIDSTQNGATQTIVSQVTYHPFGVVKAFVNGANQTITRGIDLDGRINTYTLGADTYWVGYDAASRISYISNMADLTNTQEFAYDNLDRLTGYNGTAANQSFAYDLAGNRTSKLVGTNTTSYTSSATSNRLIQLSGAENVNYQLDSNGSVTQNGSNQFTFDARGRMVAADTALGPVQYKINALGHRITKTVSGTTTVFHYDLTGTLIGESTGAAQKDYIYLYDLPVSVGIGPSVAQTYYIHADHLNTPRLIVGQVGSPVWQWDQHDPFGNNPANQDPSSAGTEFDFNLRFAGQYFDKETNLHYNYFRDYDPSTGRYVQSDPIGLIGGINTYGYVEGNPVSSIDPYGLQSTLRRALGSNGLPGSPGSQEEVNRGAAQELDELARRLGRAAQRAVDACMNWFAQGPKVPPVLEPNTNPPQAPVIPEDWVSRPGRNGGEVYYPPGTDPANGENIRVMPPGSTPVPGLNDGYWIWTNPRGQPLDPSTGKPGSRGQTHVPLPPNSMPPTRRP